MDKLLAHCGTKFNSSMERAMDSNEHEKVNTHTVFIVSLVYFVVSTQERGITITSKYTRLYYKDFSLHVVDTPGHADFGVSLDS